MAEGPLDILGAWLKEASGERWAAVMTLATVSAEGSPSARAVVVRDLDERGLVFLTDERSRKGVELANDPRAAGVILWPAQARQARVEGRVRPLADEESDIHFAGAERATRVAVWAVRQSDVVADRTILERAQARAEADHAGEDPVRRPPWWRAFRLVPSVVELWQEREDQPHDRFRYRRDGDGWAEERLAP